MRALSSVLLYTRSRVVGTRRGSTVLAVATDETRRQGARLLALRQSRGWSKPDLALRLDLESTYSYSRYERGETVIRFDQVPKWAAAFEMSIVDFSAYVFGDAPLDQDWSFRAALRGILTESVIDELAPRWERESIINQRAAVQGILEILELERKAATAPPQTRGA